jgi:kynureninase
VVDERRPDVIRVAPAPLYNKFTDVYDFVQIFRSALDVAVETNTEGKSGVDGTNELLQTT